MARKQERRDGDLWDVHLTGCQMMIIKELVATAINAAEPHSSAPDYDGIVKRVSIISLREIDDYLNGVTG